LSDKIQTMHINENIEKGYGFSAAARAGEILYIGGLVSWNEEGEVIGVNDAEAQANNIYAQIKKILAVHDASFSNVASETIYITDWAAAEPAFEIRSRYYNEDTTTYPSAAAIQVNSLVNEGLLIEVQMVAHL
jgi:enamine deaminase RidA (YjgF/YER057c/UK114 family)